MRLKLKGTLFIFLSLLSGCAQLLKGQEQPVEARNAKEGIYFTSCSGAAEHWLQCNNKAMRTCAKGYSVLEKTENANGGFRTMTFKCN